MKFPYVEFAGGDFGTHIPSLYRPVVPVHFRGVGRTVRRLGLVDTGSDFTLLPAWMPSALGIPLDANPSLSDCALDGAELQARAGQVTFEIRRNQTSLRWTGLAHFADQQYVLLGNLGFLEFFSATFDWSQKSLELIPSSRFPTSNS
jgi:hypothetical protein